jgi:hypothetical protein
MNLRIDSRRAALAAAALLLVTATSCGTLPTQPGLDDTTQASTGPIAHNGAQAMESDPSQDVVDNPGVGTGNPPPAPIVIIETYNPGTPGNNGRGWGKGGKKHPR